ncbi:MAG: 4-hydroxyacetophenone monooxygenase [Pseudonocardiales bacterium]|nr:4-hydroxyacetophenone monooxygenase [Pseudonocardiales bacterium]
MTDDLTSEPLLDVEMGRVSEDELRDHLTVANIPSLLMVLFQLTGERKWIAAPFLPVPQVRGTASADDDTGGLSLELQEVVRTSAAVAIMDWHAGAPVAVPAPTGDLLVELMSACTGEAVPEIYGPMIAAQLRFEPVPLMQPDDPASVDDFQVVVIGAGISGLVMAYRLQRAGIPFVVLERGQDVGGVWRDNRYPGAGVDTANEMYSFSFFANDWSMHYSKRDEMMAYFRRFADTLDLRRTIRFGTQVTGMKFDESEQVWRVGVRTADGEGVVTANVVVSAMGIFAEPKMPNISGLDRFRGPMFHSSRWPEDLDVSGKRVAVVGTGASAMQIVPGIADKVGSLHVFQRTPPWISPSAKYFQRVPAGHHWLLNHVPYYREWNKFRMAWLSYDKLFPTLKIDRDWPHLDRSINAENDLYRQNLTKYIESELVDRPDLIAKTVPDYPAFGKRMLLDNGWYRALRKPQVELIDESVTTIDETGLVTASGVRRDVDIIVLCTGFETTRYLGPIDVVGRGGVELHDVWGDDNAEAYLSFMVPSFPNLLLTYGPNSQGSGGSFTLSAELQSQFVIQVIVEMLNHDLGTLEPRREVFEDYMREIDGRLRDMIWSHPNVTTYYKNRHGRVVVPRPYSVVDWWHMLRWPRLENYQVESRRRLVGADDAQSQ